MTALENWRAALTAWVIPPHIAEQATESPWVLPREVFTGRLRAQLRRPAGASYEIAAAALDPPGTVLDVGSGPGAACLPLADRATAITAVDADEPMLAELAAESARLGVPARTVLGRWPDAAPRVTAVDVVLCHHVLYNVADLMPFVAELTAHARRMVVVEMSERHPLISLNPLWERFHGLARPQGPTAEEAEAALRECGVRPQVRRFARPPTAEYPSFERMVEVTRRRLCLSPDRVNDVAVALRDMGVDPDSPPDLGSSGRELVTLWWTPE